MSRVAEKVLWRLAPLPFAALLSLRWALPRFLRQLLGKMMLRVMLLSPLLHLRHLLLSPLLHLPHLDKAWPERQPWRACDVIFETCAACGAEWRFWQDVIQKKTVITGYHRGGAVQCRIAGSCETCQVVWVVP